MADIDVERKGRSIWPWILGLLVLALLAWALIGMFGDDEAEVMQDPVVTPVTPPPPAAPMDTGAAAAVSAYLSQCTNQQGSPAGEMGVEHEFTVNCFRQLRQGIDAVAARRQPADANVSQALEGYASTLQELEQSDTTAATHANLTRDAASTAAEVLQSMRTAWFAGDQQVETAANEVQQAVEAIDPTVAQLEQRESIRTFFREAGEALQMMSRNSAASPSL